MDYINDGKSDENAERAAGCGLAADCGQAVGSGQAPGGGRTPAYRQASFTGDSVALENGSVNVTFFKRLSGWGFAELRMPDGRLMAVLDHLGELLLRDQEIPMRFESDSYKYTRDADSGVQTLAFPVKTTMPRRMLAGTSFENWVRFPFAETAAEGTVTFALADGESRVRVCFSLTSNHNLYARYLRCVWLLAGESSFGTRRIDALLPGVDWCVGDEWSSGADFFKDPWANRSIPLPYQVTAPFMAVSADGDAVGISWDSGQTATRWFNYRDNHPQPVFASPNFLERRNNSLIGLTLPEVFTEADANKAQPDTPLELHIGQRIDLDAEIFIAKGNSMDALAEWVTRNGLPPVPEPRWPLPEALDRIARAYNTNLWHEGEGFGAPQHIGEKPSIAVPRFLRRYVNENDTVLSRELKLKIEWCDGRARASGKPAPFTSHHGPVIYGAAEAAGWSGDELARRRARCDEILSWQKPDGSFRFEPDGRHYTKDDFRVARSFIEPMGADQDTALHICTMPAMELLLFYRAVKTPAYGDAARWALDFAMDYIRPEGGDYWETPLHAANLLAAGQAANACYLAYEIFKDDKYRRKAIYWLRALLPFTHLWEAGVDNIYNTKPCLCSSDWYFANWVRDHVQWEVLESFANSAQLGFAWGDIDAKIDWRRYQEGVTTATFRWMADHRRNDWRPHNLPHTYDAYLRGEYDFCFADTHNSVTGNYGGALIMPSVVADNIYALLDYAKKT